MFALLGRLFITLSFSSIVVLNGCGLASSELSSLTYGPESDACIQNHAPIGGIQFDCQISLAHYQIFSSDLSLLKNLHLQGKASERLRNLLNLPDTRPATLVAWLEERMKIMLSDGFYAVNEDEQKEILAFNFGAHVFRIAKAQKDHRPKANVPGIGLVNIDSPRVGLIQFLPAFFATKKHSIHQLKDQIKRLGVLFHEARHSDGNGDNLGFPHSACPKKNGVRDGIFQCDSAANGPNAVQALFLESVAENLYFLILKQVQSQEFASLITKQLRSELLDDVFIRNQYITAETSSHFVDDAPEYF